MPDFLEFRDLIGERAGVFTTASLGFGFLEGCLRARMEQIGCGSLAEYYQILSRNDERAETEFLHLITALSTNASSFYRHRETTRILVDTILPQLVANGSKSKVVIWSAGCSTGEEPVSIAMALAEAGWFDRAEVTLAATDANLNSLAQAKSGLFGSYRMRALASELRDKYFTQVGEDWRFTPELHQRIDWSVLNLANEREVARQPTAEVIFCQKVFIHFADAKVAKILRSLEDRMAPGGYLFADQGDIFESMMSQLDLFDRHEIDGISLWKKRRAAIEKSVHESSRIKYERK